MYFIVHAAFVRIKLMMIKPVKFLETFCLSYPVKQPIFFIVIDIIKTKAHFVNHANILIETNLLHNNHS